VTERLKAPKGSFYYRFASRDLLLGPQRMAVAISAAAGGPSAAMPTATVRQGVAASDDRKRDATQRKLRGRGWQLPRNDDSGRPQQRHLPVGPDSNAVIRIRTASRLMPRGQRAATCGSKWMVLVFHCS
jgi:hypothetical protein